MSNQAEYSSTNDGFPRVSILGKGCEVLAHDLGIDASALEECDVALFIVSAHDGIARADIDYWNRARELYIPSIVIISETDSAELDFDDMCAIASKMLDPLLVQYLIIYDDDGKAIALIDLATMKLINYSSGTARIEESEVEHREVVEPFRVQYEEMLDQMDDNAFSAGLIFPALPWIAGQPLALDILKKLITQVPRLS